MYKLAKARLPTALEAKFAEFPVVMLDLHGKDIQVKNGSQTATPNESGRSTPLPVAPPPQPKKVDPPKALNTRTIKVKATFMATAEDLFGLLTDERRIPSWTRAPAVSRAEPGTEYSLFGGGVKGKYVSLTPGKEIVQKWALQSPTWPSGARLPKDTSREPTQGLCTGHDATLTTTLVQSDDSTKVTFSLAGVPTGLEDELTRNLEGY